MRRAATNEARWVESIASAEMEHEIVEKVMSTTRENEHILAQETGIRPSLGEDDLIEYLEEVVKELKIEKEKKKSQQ
jgi:hypothetical protein